MSAVDVPTARPGTVAHSKTVQLHRRSAISRTSNSQPSTVPPFTHDDCSADQPDEKALAQRALAHEAALADCLSRDEALSAAVAEARQKRSRHDRREALEALMEQTRDEALRDEARQHLDQANEACWQLALDAEDVARFEIGRRRFGARLTRNDLLQEATLGLYEAACRFEPSRGLRFSTYARWWVRAHLNKVQQHGLSAVRVPDSALRSLRKVHEARRALAAQGGSDHQDAVADQSGLSADRVHRVLSLMRSESLDVVPEGGQLPRKQLLPANTPMPDERAATSELVDAVRQTLDDKLDPRERTIMVYRYGLGGRPEESFRAIGERLDLTGERVRQLHRRALKTMRSDFFAQA